MFNLSLDNDPNLGLDSPVPLTLVKTSPLPIDLSDLFSFRAPYTPSSLSTYDSISVKAEEDIFKSISTEDSTRIRTIEELSLVESIIPKKMTLGDIVKKRAYNKKSKESKELIEKKKEQTRRRKQRAMDMEEDKENIVVKKEKLEHGEFREVPVSLSNKSSFPEIVLKDGRAQIKTPVALSSKDVKVKQELQIIQGEKKKMTTSVSFKQSNHTEKWTETETEKFYRALKLFGTEFSMVAKVFKHRNRTQIKNKFLREEKMAPEKINTALKEPGAINISTLLKQYGKHLQKKQIQSQILQNKMKNNEESNYLWAEYGECESSNQQKKERSRSFDSSTIMDSLDLEIMEDLADVFSSEKVLMNNLPENI